MPLRGEFDVEWENDAELMLADMDFRPNEPEADRSKCSLPSLSVSSR